MIKQNDNWSNDREYVLREYLDALEAADLMAQEAILDRTMLMSVETGDASLEATLWEINVATGKELLAQDAKAETAAQGMEAALVLSLAQSIFSTPVGATRHEVEVALAEGVEDDMATENDPPPLTLRDVGARLRVDPRRVPVQSAPTLRALVTRLETETGEVPVEREHLTERGALALLSILGFNTAGQWIGRQFHETMLSLQMSREQQLRLVAARRSRNSHGKSGSDGGRAAEAGISGPEEKSL